jgi:hypothetical protein
LHAAQIRSPKLQQKDFRCFSPAPYVNMSDQPTSQAQIASPATDDPTSFNKQEQYLFNQAVIHYAIQPETYSTTNWEDFAAWVPSKTARQCHQHYDRTVLGFKKRFRWTKELDSHLLRLFAGENIRKHGVFTRVAKEMAKVDVRITPRSCRDRIQVLQRERQFVLQQYQ